LEFLKAGRGTTTKQCPVAGCSEEVSMKTLQYDQDLERKIRQHQEQQEQTERSESSEEELVS